MELVSKNTELGGNERFYIKLPDYAKGEAKVFVEYTAAVEKTVKPMLIDIFKHPFLDSEVVRFGDLIKRDFEANREDVEIFSKVMKMITNNSIIKSINIIES